MRLSEYLRSDFVVARLNARDVEGIVDEVSSCAADAGVAPSQEIAVKLLERERQHSTVMGSGLAIPHATVPGLSQPVIGIALAPEPVQFGPPETDPVRVFVILLSPPGRETEHVKLLARICRLMRHEDFMAELDEAEDEEEILQIIEAVDAQHV